MIKLRVISIVKKALLRTIEALKKDGDEEALLLLNDLGTIDISLEVPKDDKHGDFATNLAMLVAKKIKVRPHDIAKNLITQVLDINKKEELIEKVEIAGPGFINFFIFKKVYKDEMFRILTKKEDYGKSDIGSEKKVRIEFVSANPTGPLHVGHGRGAVIGDVLSSIFTFAGYDVVREYYLNDRGNQMNILGRTAREWKKALGQGEKPAFLTKSSEGESWYKGAYMEDVSQGIQTNLEEEDFHWGLAAADVILEKIKNDLAYFGVKPFDAWLSERHLYDSGDVAEVVDTLRKKGLIIKKEGAEWFLSSEMGDDADRVLKKSNGEWTYLTADIALHDFKFQTGCDQVIDIWGADHHGYIARVKGAVQALGHDPKQMSVILCQLVRLMRSGEPVPMSTRSGEFIELRTIIEEVGKDVARFFFLMRKVDAHLDFDLDVAKKQSMDNPVYYIQYAHARICNIESVFDEEGLTQSSLKDILLEELSCKEEVFLMKKLSRFQEVIEICVISQEPYYLTVYLREVAASFHSFYRKCRVITSDSEKTQARFALARATKHVLKNGLEILGLSAPLKM
ncbi:arginine--tRNA ligase [PVC group bacterium (ex Bugula neritina AB1)]|nr:arginine--tRNA ligase [PVC group bacterium (ex Bugula neritina AB1)]